ncbi:MAG: hypothetical protein Q8O13_00390 [Candidatus Omnitrophota bacterium]|nr:hypothetical protein [Candidatus Omnitrophota bacterium]
MDQKKLEKEIIQFKSDLKQYQEIVWDIWIKMKNYTNHDEVKDLIKTKETSLREKLIEDFGRLEKYLIKIGIAMNASKQGRVFPIFDSALDEDLYENLLKSEALSMAVQMAIKAVGVVKSMDNKEFEKLEKKIPTIFIPYNFGEKNKEITSTFKDFISKFNVAISVGSEADTISVSEKVKTKIDNADIVVAIMTKDEQDDRGNWSPAKWIIEELAYALAGKNKEIIRLIEQGCTTDGRIFGDREYIPFNRENPTDTLIKLAEVLNKKIA